MNAEDRQSGSFASRALPAVWFGLVAGALLGVVRAPQGLDLIQTQAAAPSAIYGWRAAALAAVAAGLGLARTPLAVGPLLFGLALGYGAVALLVDPWALPQSSAGLVLRLGLGFGALVVVGRLGRPASEEAARDEPATELVGVALAGFGFTLAADAVGDWSALWTDGRPMDAGYSTTILAVLGWLGYASFKDLVRATGATKPERGPVALTGLLALAAAGALGGVALLGTIAGRETLEPFLLSFHSRLSKHGMWDFAGLVAARTWALPGLLGGIALAGVRRRADLVALTAGAALAHATLPGLRPLFFERGGDAGPAAATCAATGTVVAIAGTLWLALARRGSIARRAWGLGCAAVALAAVLLVPHPRFTPMTPWGIADPDQELGLARSVGYLSVESARGFSEVLTVHRRRVSPIFEEESADRVRLELSVGLLPPEVVERGARVLFVGALTPSRVRALGAIGVTAIDRTAPWFDDLAAIEAELFDGAPPPGDLVAPADALERIDAGGAWDLVISPPSFGGRAVVPPLDPGDGTVVVCWYLAEFTAADLDWGDRVLLATDGLLDPCIGVVAGDWSPERTSSGGPDVFRALDAPIALLPAGEPVRRASAAERLTLAPFPRTHDPIRRTLGRLAAAAETERERLLTAGLSEQALAQLPDPNWANRVTSSETVFDALAKLRDAALGDLLDATTAHLWEELATMLMNRRDIQAIFDFVEPIAAGRPFWPRIEEVLAYADREFLEPGSAAARFERLVELTPFDLDRRLVLAEMLEQDGRPAEAARQYEACLEIQPDRHLIERRLAMALVRAGDPRGLERIQELLAEEPDDEELATFLGPGPYPPVEPSFQIGGHQHTFGGEDEHDHDGHDH